jgi:hypothetical protein
LARLLLNDPATGEKISQGELTMTNSHSIGGSMVWIAVAAVLMLVTFEPVSTAQQPAAFDKIAAKAAPADQV